MKQIVKLAIVISLGYSIVGCNSGTTTSSNNNVATSNAAKADMSPTILANNQTQIYVDGGVNKNDANIPYVTITLCNNMAGIPKCEKIDHILLDTGSTGLRVTESALSTDLYQALENQPYTYESQDIFQCTRFLDGYVFGPILHGVIGIGGEISSTVPIQVIVAPGHGIPDSCTNSGKIPFEDVLHERGANGILGINVIDKAANENYLDYLDLGNYQFKQIPGAVISELLNINAIAAFESNNNGAIISFPAVPKSTNQPLTGTLTFGIGTQSNNKVAAGTNILLGDPNSGVGNFKVGSSMAIFDTGAYASLLSKEYTALCENSTLFCPPATETVGLTLTNYDGSGPISYNLLITNNGPDITKMPTITPGVAEFISDQPVFIFGLPSFYGKTMYLGFTNGLTTVPYWGILNNPT